jgi:hypothetical protein
MHEALSSNPGLPKKLTKKHLEYYIPAKTWI